MKTVSIDRAAEILQVSRRTIYNHIRRGYLQTIRTIGGQSQRVTLESLALVQGAGRRRGERFFVADRGSDAARIPESSPGSDGLNHLNEQSLEFLSRPTLRTAQDVVTPPASCEYSAVTFATCRRYCGATCAETVRTPGASRFRRAAPAAARQASAVRATFPR
jgi:excisionase family DNA binding protein